jgi:prepilin-type N-terminal cleavage/methylation domain-containing protein
MIEQRKRNRGQGGFTLIELLVVIAILAILAGVAIFAVGGLNESADKSACLTEKDTINTAIQAFKADQGVYPANDYTLYTDYTAVGPPPINYKKLLDKDPKYFDIGTADATNWAKSSTQVNPVKKTGAPC